MSTMNTNSNGNSNSATGVQSHKNYLRPKQVIGSCKLPISFKSSQSVFHHDDIPAEKRERKNKVMKWARSKILSVEQPEWSKSSALDPSRRPICERRTMENFVNDRSGAYQYNYRAEVLPDKLVPPLDKSTKFHITSQTPEMTNKIKTVKLKDKTGVMNGKFKITEELPIHPKLEDAIAWDNGTQLVRKKVEAAGREFTKASLAANKKKNIAMFGTKYVKPPPSTTTEEDQPVDEEGEEKEKPKSAPEPTCKYVSPMQSSSQILEEVRRQKKAGTFSTKRTVFQKVEAPVDRSKLGNRLAIEPSRKYKVTEHSGKWEYNAIEGRYMWSDTGSFVYESRGDITYIKNPDAYNYVTPNAVQPSWKTKAAATAARTLQPPTAVTSAPRTAATDPGIAVLSALENEDASPSVEGVPLDATV